MRLLKRVEYEAVYGVRQRRSSPQFAVFFRSQHAIPREAPGENAEDKARAEAKNDGARRQARDVASGPDRASRFGISVKKALGGAVVRNRIRRRIREILRRNRTEIPTGWDIVIHPRPSVAEAPFASLEAELVRLLRGIAPKA